MQRHVSVTVGLREVSREAAIVRDGERQLEESCWNIITPHLEAVEVATMDSCSEDGIDSEQEEVVVTSGSVRCLSVGRRGGGFHCTESGRHAFERVVWEELELQEAKESEEDCVRRNIALVNELEDFVGYEHLCELFSDSRSYCMLVIVH